MVSFESFVKSIPSLSELKVTPSFCFALKIPDDPTTSNVYAIQGRHQCGQGQVKLPLYVGASPLPPTHSVLQNQGKTLVLPVLPPMAYLLLLRNYPFVEF